MGGLGNGRRGGRSPPLMIGALIAFVLVLGFNYWLSNSRNLELQTKLDDLEAQMRRSLSEHGVDEVKKNEFQAEIHRLKEESSRMQSLNKRLEGVQNTCTQEKTSQRINISSSSKTIQDLKSQLQVLKVDSGKCEKEFQTCQGRLNNLNSKLTYDMTQCNTQILSQKEECDEKVAAAKQEVQKKLDKINVSLSSQNNTAPTQKGRVLKEAISVEEAPEKTVVDDTKTTPVNGHAPVSSVSFVAKSLAAESLAADRKASELETNEILVDKAVSSMKASPPSTGVKGTKPETVEETRNIIQLRKSNMTKNTKLEVIDTHGGVPPPKGADDILLIQRNEEEALIGQENEEEALIGQKVEEEALIGQKVEDPEEDYDGDEPIVGGVDLDNQNPMSDKIDKQAEREMQEELADYNGDDENEGEFEADKQEALTQF
ncbi:hypothetical protein DPEC_G00123460 [Dallia pectoralis]|uniref:Uncharacterized protein n=1 Tax=Dallia pectoralis TaxID=75939 RepID=A0ACC2GQJ0_DALPE|nr:hypothetical protein DPEC_G00123460 [Dallia pectoralis]